jgi:hypothetical protein
MTPRAFHQVSYRPPTFYTALPTQHQENPPVNERYTHCAFPFLPLKIRRLIALYDSFQMSVDHDATNNKGSLHRIATQLSTGQRITHLVWIRFFAALPPIPKHYGPYAQAIIFRGALEFMQATYFEHIFFRGYSGSLFPAHLRLMSAQGPVQAALCFPDTEFPETQYLQIIATLEAEMVSFVGTVTDLFSYHKEGDTEFERMNYPHNELACSERSVLTILRELVEVSLVLESGAQNIGIPR